LATSTGGTITTAGGYRIHTFLNAQSGTDFVASGSGTVEYLVIGAGGEGGEYGGGGGAGGYLSGSTSVSATAYPITVGLGTKHPSSGSYNLNGARGGNSVFSSITATGGGGGGSWDGGATSSLDGGSGGGMEGHASGGGGGAGGAGGNGTGGAQRPTRAGTGIVGQGFPGGLGYSAPAATSGNGGIGLASSITGSSVVRAGGGGGGTHQGTSGIGGSGIGGNGEAGSGPSAAVKNTAPTENTGSGAGGHQDDTQNSSYIKGANGIVIIRYPI
jgi:hypothetical protein